MRARIAGRTEATRMIRWRLAGSAWLASSILCACGGEHGASAPPPIPEMATVPSGAMAPVTTEELTPATATPSDTTGSSLVAEPAAPTAAPADEGPDSIEPGVWYADTTPPPSEGPGSLADLDTRIASAQAERLARVVGRVRLAARGRPRISVGLVLLARAADGDDAAVAFPIAGDDASRAPSAGARGDERRNGPWVAGGIEAGTTTCDDQAPPTLVLFRAVHMPDGSVDTLAFLGLGEVCTVLGHDLVFGDLDDDRSTEVRLRTRTGGVMDMSAGRERVETLHIVDVASWQVQLELEAAVLEAAEVDGYGGRTREGDITLRDLDGDGDRDVVFTHRDEVRTRSDDDSDEEAFRSSEREAYTYDPRLDRYERAEGLDPE